MSNIDFVLNDTTVQQTVINSSEGNDGKVWNVGSLNDIQLEESVSPLKSGSTYVFNDDTSYFEVSTPKIIYNQSMTENERSDLIGYFNTFNRTSKKEVCISIYPNAYINVIGQYAYSDSVYSPTQNRIYFIPFTQIGEIYWNYIDCVNGTIQKYINPFYGSATLKIYAYNGGVYSPTQNRIYFVPYAQSDQEYWHYIDCDDGTVQQYLNPFYGGVNIQSYAYNGGVYSPNQNRIYFVPLSQSNQDYWHYIDCDDGTVHSYNNININRANADGYLYGSYSPTQDRIYFVPYGQSDKEYWHYIDCSDGTVQKYLNPFFNGVNLQSYAYNGGVYSPTQNRIYFVPYGQADQEYWHYIDCDDGTVQSYLNPFFSGLNLQLNAYSGGVYSPNQNRIYFVPYTQSDQDYWHYIDCDDGTVHSYNNININRANVEGYLYGSYSPTQDRIYFAPYNQSDKEYWNYIDCSTGTVQSYLNSFYDISKMVAFAYQGGVYSPTQNRIYFVPYAQSDQEYWHYIDCDDGSIRSYLNPFFNGVNLQPYAYIGGVYSPNQNRIYLVPYNQALEDYWHYIDCNDGIIYEYSNLITNRPIPQAYCGGVYSPTQNRIYFVPYGQTDQPYFHYIDCYDGTIQQYLNPFCGGVILQLNAYSGGVYSPTQNRIYFVPYAQADQDFWHYIDCDDGSIKSYLNIATDRPISNAYNGGVYSPTQNRIYFVPYGQADQEYWHYIDCDDGTLNKYLNPFFNSINTESYAYQCGVYSPTQNRIYFVPAAQAYQDYWHYIDCTDGSVQSYPNIYTNKPVYNAYNGGVYSPTQNRIYFVPYSQSTVNYFHCIDELSKFPVDRGLMASECYNKF